MKKGEKMTEEQKNKIGIANAISNLGKKHSIETKEKMSRNSPKFWKGKKRPNISEKLRISNTGKIISKETKDKISFKNKGKIPWNKGKTGLLSKESIERFKIASTGRKKSIETRKKIANLHRGSKSHLWKGGINKVNNTIRNSFELKLWRESVFERDNYSCCKCFVKSGQGKVVILNAHHIQNFSSSPELRFRVDNGITLCKSCHGEFHKLFTRFNNNHNQLNKYMKIKELIKDTIEDTYIDHETHIGDLRDDCSECFKEKEELTYEKLQAEAEDRFKT